MKKIVLLLGLLYDCPLLLSGMSLETATVTNKAVSFLDVYKVGLLLFENRSSSTNLDYLGLSLPLMLKEGLKKNSDFFVLQEEILGVKEQIRWERKAGVLPFRKKGTAPLSLAKDGKPVARPIAENRYERGRARASGRKQLEFSSTVIRQNEQTLDEIARDKGFHYLLFGDYSRIENAGITVRAHLYSAISGRTIHSVRQVYPDGQVLLNLKTMIQQMRKKMVRFSTVPLKVVTDPPGAVVYTGKLYQGETPLLLPFTTATNHELFIRKTGYKKLRLDINLKPGKQYLLKRKLTRIRGTGSIQIVSHPPGAEVRVDLLFKGKTPLTLTNMATGLYRISLERENYHRKYSRIQILRNKTETVNITLSPKIEGALTIEQQVKRHKKWMNIFFWAGGVSLLSYTYCYIKREDYQHQYSKSGSSASSLRNKVRDFDIAADISLWTTAGCMAVSAYFLVRYMMADDRDLGRAPLESPPSVYAAVAPGGLLVNWRF